VVAAGTLIDPQLLAQVLARRIRTSTYGPRHHRRASGMVGAAWLAGRASLRLGTGRVYVGMIDHSAPALDPLQPELMLRNADGILKLEHLDALAVGPGMGQSAVAKGLLKNALRTALPLVLDAVAQHPRPGILRAMHAGVPTVITRIRQKLPHAGCERERSASNRIRLPCCW
jgi:hypothetical protein